MGHGRLGRVCLHHYRIQCTEQAYPTFSHRHEWRYTYTISLDHNMNCFTALDGGFSVAWTGVYWLPKGFVHYPGSVGPSGRTLHEQSTMTLIPL